MRWFVVVVALAGLAGCATQSRAAHLEHRLDSAQQRVERQAAEREALENRLSEARGSRLQLAVRIDGAYLAYQQALDQARHNSHSATKLAVKVARLESELATTPILTMSELGRLRKVTATAIGRAPESRRAPLQTRLAEIDMPREDDIAGRNRAYHQLHELIGEARR